MRLNRWLRRLWLLNGIIFLIGSSIFTFQLIQSYFRTRPEERGPIVGDRLEKAITDSLVLQDVSLSLPRSIGISPYRFIQVVAKDYTTPVRVMKYSDLGPPPSMLRGPDYSYENNVLSGSGNYNLLFFKGDGADPRLLLDKKCFILSADIPAERDSIQSFNVYRLIFTDTDGDGRLTRFDRSDLYCSDINGLHLRQITNDSLRIVRYTKALRESKLYVQVKVRPTDSKTPEADWQERILVYDVKSSQLAPLVAEEGVLKQVRQILWSK
jgi:hypothetical protein